MKFELLFSKLTAKSYRDIITEISLQNTWNAFDDRAVKFVNEFSFKLLKHPQINSYPDLVALAYWFRKSKIKRLKEKYTSTPNNLKKGKGLAFHVSPSNVDTIFIYSFFISLLAGNYNLIRISRNSSEQVDILLNIFKELSKNDEHECAKRFVICTYDHDQDITSFFSSNCDLRILWGGDTSVNEISSYQIKPTASEIKFPDRTSFSIINLSQIKKENDEVLNKLAMAFYKDIELFGQQACSSPKAVFFVGKKSDKKFAKIFTDKVNEQTAIQVKDSQNMNRYVSATSMSIKKAIDTSEFTFDSKKVTFLEGLLGNDNSFRDNHFGEGLVIQYFVKDLEQVSKYVNEKDQTVSVFGFSNDELIKFIDTINNRGVDRVVPIGTSLEFEHIWDGNDLFETMSRNISISSNI